jgi:hypothetical protein
VQRVERYAKKEAQAWAKKHSSKLNFGKKLSTAEKQELTYLLYALREVFATNPEAPPAVEGIEYALHFNTKDPTPMCRKLPKLSVQEKEQMSKDCLQMLVNEIIEFSYQTGQLCQCLQRIRTYPMAAVEESEWHWTIDT